MHDILDEHRGYLSDRTRLDAFARALAHLVRPGDIVVDLGSGTGVLGLLALRAGAAHVYAIEETALAGAARAIASANGLADRLTVIRERSTSASLPARAHVVVTDQIGYFGVDAGICEYLTDARRRFLIEGGATAPSRVTCVAAPVEHQPARERVRFWSGRHAGLDLSPMSALAGSTAYPVDLTPDDCLAEPASLWTIDPGGGDALLDGSIAVDVLRSGLCDGLAGWFTATLAGDVAMTNDPRSAPRIQRHQLFMPIDPTPVQPGDRVSARVRIRTRSLLIDWTVRITTAAGAERVRITRSTFEGVLLSHEDLAGHSGDARPRLTRRGAAQRTVLEMCDGGHSVAAIESSLRERFSDVLRDDEEVAGFVGGVLARHAI